ncbi:probable cytochrome P450 6a14 [Rhopalosiphum padi]|uniref:CYP6CY7 n=1 Tax=Rhopalosiphum padi TaxID=40932 RepID=A0A6H1X4H9_RHOPD|nr:probable cytochrome P450 6a14 [Rhopalosiphum padi]QJA10281.1 CYP6CY7 [Rhopalosiphum padi]UOW66133.1 cytochrome P450 6CY7 [Rhopalosiphum padi]WOV89621.1 cytochrome P450 CYP6CY7 [Rhopalosiphum padi]
MITFISSLIIGLFGSVYVLYATVFLSIAYYFSTCTHDKWRKLNVPYTPPLPLFGNSMKMILTLEHPIDFFGGIYDRFSGEKFCGFYQMTTPFLMIRDPELINSIMVKDFSYFTDHGVETDPSINILANSLFLLNGDRWRTMRQKLSPGFTSGKLKDTHEQIKGCIDQLMNAIEDKLKTCDHFELREIVANFATDVIGASAFGLKLDTIKNGNSDFRKFGKKVFQANLKQLFLQALVMLWPKLVLTLKLQQFPEDASEFYVSMFREVLEYRSRNNIIRNDVTQTLIKARKDLVLDNDGDDSTSKNKWTEMDIIGNAILMFVAGSETVSTLICFCLYELALNRNVQDRLREEIVMTKAKHGGQLNSDFLTDLRYINMVIEEVSRIYSITLIILRQATKNYKVPGQSLVIEKGQKIVIPIRALHHDPKYYPNPDTFNPERFSAEEKSKRPNGTFIPFGDGPRLCIGKRLAELEIKFVLTEILLKYEVLPCEKTEIPINIRGPGNIINPKNGIWLNFKPIVVT